MVHRAFCLHTRMNESISQATLQRPRLRLTSIVRAMTASNTFRRDRSIRTLSIIGSLHGVIQTEQRIMLLVNKAADKEDLMKAQDRGTLLCYRFPRAKLPIRSCCIVSNYNKKGDSMSLP